MTDFYHVCFVVPDIEQTMRDFRRSAGVEWSDPVSDRMGEWDYRIVFSKGGSRGSSKGGPPFIELITGPAGSPWDASEGARFDHIGFWSSDVTQSSRRLEKEGMPMDFSGCPYGRPFAYHRMDSIGARIEFVDVSRQAAFLSGWHPEGDPMPAVDESSRG